MIHKTRSLCILASLAAATALIFLFAPALVPAQQQQQQAQQPQKQKPKVSESQSGSKEKEKIQPKSGAGEPDRKPNRYPSPEKKPAESAGTSKERPHPKQQPVREMKAWMGLATGEVPESVREHFDLEEGLGIQVEAVIEGSPADDAGLRQHDILLKLDDQLLTSPSHLATLVRLKEKGDEVTLTLIRKGSEKSASVVLGESEMTEYGSPPHHPFRFHMNRGEEGDAPVWRFEGSIPLPENLPSVNPEDWSDALREYQDKLKEWREQMPDRPRFDAPSMQHPPEAKPAPKSDDDAPAKGEPSDHRHGHDPASSSGLRPPALSVNPGSPVHVFAKDGIVKIENPHGAVTIADRDGKHHIVIRDPEGESLFEGDYDVERGVESLPHHARSALKDMKLENLRILTKPASGAPSVELENPTDSVVDRSADGAPL